MSQTLTEFFEELEPKSDKNTSHCYIDEYYSKEFTPKKELPLKLMEIGVREGLSHNLWSKFFTKGHIVGVDNGESGFTWDILKDTNVEIFKTDAYTKSFADLWEDNFFDYIVDDGPHSVESQMKAIDLFLSKVKPGGKLIIEDIQAIEFAFRLGKHCHNNPLIESFEIHDLRHVKDRLDDILIEIVRK